MAIYSYIKNKYIQYAKIIIDVWILVCRNNRNEETLNIDNICVNYKNYHVIKR